MLRVGHLMAIMAIPSKVTERERIIMSRLESTRRLLRRWFTSIAFFAVLGLILGGLIAFLALPKPNVALISISDVIVSQNYTDDILDTLQRAWVDNNIKAVVSRINSPGGSASAPYVPSPKS